MGGGQFTYEAYERISSSKSYANASRDEIFTSRKLDPAMDPSTITFRESRDSAEHPNSLAIIVALDVTGSMGFVPESIVKETLPQLVGSIIEAGIPDPQVLFLGIGDQYYDDAPLQVGQFESSAELLDKWLTKVYLEGGGGGNNNESYTLAHLIAARHTAIDCLEKRGYKGFLFTVGDEPCNTEIPLDVIKRLTINKEALTISSPAIIKEAQEKYEVFHIHVEHDELSKSDGRQAHWKEYLGERFIVIDDYKQLSKLIARTIIEHSQKVSVLGKVENHKAENINTEKPIEDML